MVYFLIVFLLLSALQSGVSDVCDYITLSSNGTDTPNCFNTSCKSLDYVVQLLNSSNSSCVDLYIDDDQVLGNSWTIKTNNFTMQGNDFMITVTCSSDVVIFLESADDVLISAIEFINCGIEGDKAAVTVNNCTNLIVTDCAFINSSSTGLAITDSQHSIYISNTLFKSNRNDRHQIDYVDHDFPNTNSYSAQNISRETSTIGGGLSIINCAATLIVINECDFVDNEGWMGGGAFISWNSLSSNTLRMKNCNFTSNTAGLLGGGLCFGDNNQTTENMEFDVGFDGVLFSGNSAPHAGGMAYHTSGQYSNKITNATINITRSIFTLNSANFSGAAVGLFRWATALKVSAVAINFRSCSWISNSIYQPFTVNSTVSGTGVIYTDGISFALLGETIIKNNYGTAILASLAQIYLWDNITVSGNSGVKGGAVNLIDKSHMVIQRGLKITFAYNIADLFGGAIYHVFPVRGVTGQNEYCVFVYYDKSIVWPGDWEADLRFIGNEALISGDSMFLSSPDTCKRNQSGKIFSESNFHYFPNYTNQITTSPVSIMFSSPSINCSVNGDCWTQIMLGERITVTLSAIDSFGNKNVQGFAAISISCMGEDDFRIAPSSSECNYRLEGTNLVEFRAGKQQTVPFYIAGARNDNYSDHILLKWQLMELPSAVGYLHVQIRNCYLGYVYNDDLEMCVCYDGENVACIDTRNYTACVSFGYWYGLFSGNLTLGTENFTTAVCPFGACDYSASGQCPTGTEQCDPDGSAYQFHCKLPKDNSDKLCLFDKGGPMCSKCRDGFSPSFPNLKCLPNDDCSLGYAALQAVLYVFYLFIFVFIVLLVARFNLRIGSGQIYCLMFYFSVFKYFVGGIFPSSFLYGVEILFTGIVQFDPAIFGLIPICSGLKINALEMVFVQLINPIVLILVISIILYVSWKWPKYAVLNTQRLGINAVCIMLYLCFVSITQTSLTLLTPAKFYDIKGVYTALDPEVEYFGKGHIVFGIIGLLLQLTLVLPFLCLLLFAPFLIRFRRLNLTKIKPILDEFQACYKTKYRYFAGYYLVCRQLIFLMSFINLGTFALIYILQILSILMLTFHLMIQPYTSNLLNKLDGLLILDLVLLSILHGNTASIVFDEVTQLKIVLVYILVLLPVVYFVILCVYPIIQFIFPRLKGIKIFKRNESDDVYVTTPVCVGSTIVELDDNSNTFTESGTLQSDSIVMLENIEREPLLFMDSYAADYGMHSVVSTSWDKGSENNKVNVTTTSSRS